LGRLLLFSSLDIRAINAPAKTELEKSMRVGIFGGSFDPIHQGHLILAEQCRQQAKLDQVLFIPSAQAPHKEKGATATDRQRVEMVDLAIGPAWRSTAAESVTPSTH